MLAAVKKSLFSAAACILVYSISVVDIPWEISNRLETLVGNYQYYVVAETQAKNAPLTVQSSVQDDIYQMTVVCNPGAKVEVLRQIPLEKIFPKGKLDNLNLLYCTVLTNAKRSEFETKFPGPKKALTLAKVHLKPSHSLSDKSVFAWTRKYVVLGQERVFRLLLNLIFIVIFCIIYQKIIGWKKDFQIARQVSKKHPHIIAYALLFNGCYTLLKGLGSSLMFINSPITEHFFGSVFYAPIVEEIFYRCLLFTFLLRYSNAWFAGFFVSILFAVNHGYDDISVTFGFFLFALTMQYIYHRHKTITLCIITHAIGNAMVMLGHYYKNHAF